MEPKDLERVLNSIDRRTSRMEIALMGDGEMNTIGLVQQVVNNRQKALGIEAKIESHIKHCDEKKNKISGAVWAFGIVWTVGIFLIGFFVKR